jgi:hypothetical protein
MFPHPKMYIFIPIHGQQTLGLRSYTQTVKVWMGENENQRGPVFEFVADSLPWIDRRTLKSTKVVYRYQDNTKKMMISY